MKQANGIEVTEFLIKLLNKPPSENNNLSLVFTGGRGANHLYEQWRKKNIFSNVRQSVDIFLTDERCVPRNHSERNSNLVSRVLFSGKIPKNIFLHEMYKDIEDTKTEISCVVDYEKSLPKSVDMMLVSMGEDGHIASLFPNSSAIFETKSKVMQVKGSKPPFDRITITPPVIEAAKQVFVLALGSEKKRMYEKALLNPEDVYSLPVRLVLDRTWVFLI